MVAALLWATVIVLLWTLVGYSLSGPRYKGQVTDHFDGKRFFNPGSVEPKGWIDVFKWLLTRKRKPWNKNTTHQYGQKPESKIESGWRITFINHTTFLLQVDGLNMLTDPIWSKRASPFAWAGPKRMQAPGIKLEDLPTIDIILLSHNHYDHCDISSLKKINEMFSPKIYTGLGVGALLRRHGIDNIAELDWWQQILINKQIELHAVPAQHFSGRGMFDTNGTLWMGFIIETQKGNIYFAADTAYHPTIFKEIGNRYAPIHLSIIPIGAYEPEWFMSPVHCSPAEAVKIHLDSQSKLSIGSHFGTFPLADEGKDQPVEDLRRSLVESKVPLNEFIVLKEGEWKQF